MISTLLIANIPRLVMGFIHDVFAHPAIATTFNIIGSLGLFLYGMKIMSDGIHKASGEGLQKILNSISSNRFFAVITGFVVTAIIQSSSATTVMVVSFVNAGLLSLQQSIGIIMGANIGTTVTGWIVSLLGFKLSLTKLALPIVGIGFAFLFQKNRTKLSQWGETLVGFGLLFMGLGFMKKAMPTLDEGSVHFLAQFIGNGFLSTVIFVVAGALLTIVVHSSSASMAMTLALVYNNVLPLEAGAAMVLGSNIGTTIDAFLASFGANVNARRAAYFHIFFNVVGSIIIMIFFRPVLGFIEIIVPGSDAVVELAAFHTAFNLFNTLLFIGFVGKISSVIEKVAKPRKDEIGLGHYKLEYITSAVQDIPETHIIQAKTEVGYMVDIVIRMFETYRDVFNRPDKKMGSKVKEVKSLEEYTDEMQEEITKYLIHASSSGSMNEHTLNSLNCLMRVVNQLESIADGCYNLLLLSERARTKKIPLRDTAREELESYSELLEKFLLYIQDHMNQPLEKEDLSTAYKLEEMIDSQRNNLKKKARKAIKKGANVKGELMFLDIVKHIESMGDYCLNIAQALRGVS